MSRYWPVMESLSIQTATSREEIRSCEESKRWRTSLERLLFFGRTYWYDTALFFPLKVSQRDPLIKER
jgi:hypothetical protein